MNKSTIPQFRITFDGLWVNGAVFAGPTSPADLSVAIGRNPRVSVANPKAPAWREVWIFDEIGIYLLCNKEPHLVSAVDFVWQPMEVPYPPARMFRGTLVFNETLLKDGLVAERLPLKGPIPLKKVFGGSYAADFEAFHLSLRLAKRRSARGRRHGIPALAYVEFAFTEVDMPETIVSKRIQRN